MGDDEELSCPGVWEVSNKIGPAWSNLLDFIGNAKRCAECGKMLSQRFFRTCGVTLGLAGRFAGNADQFLEQGDGLVEIYHLIFCKNAVLGWLQIPNLSC